MKQCIDINITYTSNQGENGNKIFVTRYNDISKRK